MTEATVYATDEILKRLDMLAAKLGVASNEIYAAYIAQAKVAELLGWVGIALGVLLLITTVSLVVNALVYQGDSGGAAVLGLVMGTVVVLVLAWAIPEVATAHYNPNYWAITHIMEDIR